MRSGYLHGVPTGLVFSKQLSYSGLMADLAFVNLPEDQRAWLWHRYIQLYPKAETDADATRAVCAQFDLPFENIKARLLRWREQPPFRLAEEQLRAGLSPDAVRTIVIQFAAANAVAGVIEQGKLINRPWDNMNQRELNAKSIAINQAIKIFLNRQSEREDKPSSMDDLMAEDPDLMRENVQGSEG